MGGTPWEGRKWAVLASLVVVAGLSALVWWLLGGCESRPQTPVAPGPASVRPEPPRGEPTIRVLQAMNDSSVIELSLQVAYFRAVENRLPADLDEVRRRVHVAGWPPAPGASSRGDPFTYRPTGERTFELVFPGKGKPPGAAGDLVIALEVPADLPKELPPEALRTWWELNYLRRMTEELQKGLRDLMPPAPAKTPPAKTPPPQKPSAP